MKIVSDPIVDIQTINSDLDALNYWAQQWAVSFSPTKSENMVITKKVNRPIYGPVLLDDIVVTKVTSHSHLGMTFTENLSWEVHIRNRIKKTAPTMNVLVRTSRILPRPVKEVIYRTFIRPVLEYGCMVYDNCQAFISHTLEQCQRTAALACTGAYRDTSHSKLLSELGWPTLAKRREYYKLCHLFKLVHTMSPTYMTDSFMVQRADHNHNYDLRNEVMKETSEFHMPGQWDIGNPSILPRLGCGTS